MSTDRPDKTESPFTVDAGHFQLEMDLVTYSHDRDRSQGGDVSVDAWSLAPLNLKAGLTPNFDVQLMISPHQRIRTADHQAGSVDRRSGFGDITVRLKRNLFGNDGGQAALGVMPYVKLPTSQDDIGSGRVEGGVILPLGLDLPAGFGLGLMSQVDLLRDGTGDGYHPEFIHSITVSHSLVGNLSGYVEFFSSVSTESGSEWVGTVDLGLTYGLTENVQLDAGVNLGVTRSADDVNPFAGVSVRF
jgi:hypothetical protein